MVMPVAGHLSPSAQGGLAVEVPAPELPSVPRLFSQTLLQHMPEQDEMRLFPGPLGKYVPAPTPGPLSGGGGCTWPHAVVGAVH